jgi:hypothetical protein
MLRDAVWSEQMVSLNLPGDVDDSDPFWSSLIIIRAQPSGMCIIRVEAHNVSAMNSPPEALVDFIRNASQSNRPKTILITGSNS